MHAGELTPPARGWLRRAALPRRVLELQPDPRGRATVGEASPDVEPTDEDFTGFVFKLQAGMDPLGTRWRSFASSAVVRTGCASSARTRKAVALSRPSQLFGQDKTVLDEGYAGDVIGLNNPGSFAIGDTLYVGKRRSLPPIPTFSPELFAYLRRGLRSTGVQKGVAELLGEGAVQVMYSRDAIKQDPSWPRWAGCSSRWFRRG